MTPLTFHRLNLLGVLGVCGVLVAAYLYELLWNELPCPLCLLQRLALIGMGFGLVMNLRFGLRPRHYAMALGSALFGAVAAGRQILADAPPDAVPYGSVVLGMHLYSWALVVFLAAISGLAALLFFDQQFTAERRRPAPRFRGASRVACALLLMLSLANVLTTLTECGLGFCGP